MENNLIFVDTFTVEQFKNATKVSELNVKRNPNTGKFFFTYGAKTGAVSSKGIPTKPMVSLVRSKDTGEEFYLLHNEGTGGAPTIATF